MQKFKISIIGTGAVGGYYGGLLANSGQEVHFLLKSDYQHVLKNGLKVDSINGNFRLPQVSCVSSIESLPPSDLLIIAAKTVYNKMIYPALASILNKEGCVLILQNGLGLEEGLAEYVDPASIFGGTCFICSNKIGPGHIQHLDYGLVKLGQYAKPLSDKHPSAMLTKIENLFLESEIKVQLIEDLILERWKKLVWNIPYNGLSVLMQAPTDKIMQDAKQRARAELLMYEVAAMAGACGKKIETSFIENMLTATEKMIPYKPSMLLDFEKGKELELASMYETPIQKSNDAGFVPAEIKKLYRQLKKMAEEKMNGPGQSGIPDDLRLF